MSNNLGISLPLGTLIRQPISQDLRVENGVMQLTEKWKGQYEHCRKVAYNLYSTEAVTYSTFLQQAGTLCCAYNTLSSPGELQWELAQATVDACDAGENGILQCIWNAAPTGGGGGGGTDWPVSETWNLEWQPENYDVYAYCLNPVDHSATGNAGSQRTAIEACLHPPTGQNIMTTKRLFAKNSGEIVELNPYEKKILKWKLEGKHVIKHHPLITKNKVWQNVPRSQMQQIMSNATSEIKPVDIVNTPDNVFNLSQYQWVSQGTNIAVSQPDAKKNEYQVNAVTKWIGSLSVVMEFYGPNHWTFGDM